MIDVPQSNDSRKLTNSGHNILPMTEATVTRPATTAAWLLESLRSSILDGTRAAHSLIRQEELAATYGVSRMPVREALRALETEGLVVNRPKRGMVVAPLDPDDALEIFDIRASLEIISVTSFHSTHG